MLQSENEPNLSDQYETLPDQIISCQSSIDRLYVDKDTPVHQYGYPKKENKHSGYIRLESSANTHSKAKKSKRSSSKSSKYRLSSFSQASHSKTMSWISESSLEKQYNIRNHQVYSPISCCSSPQKSSHFDISCTSLHYQETRDVLLSKHALEKYGIKIQRISESFYIAMIVYDSPASRAGLKVGDEIVRINEHTIESFSNIQLLELIKSSECELRISFRPRLVIARLKLVILKKVDGKFGFRVQRRSEGIFVALVLIDSPAHIAGIQEGDEIVKVNETVVSSWSQQDVTQLLRTINTDAENGEILLVVRQVKPVEDFRIIDHLHRCRQSCSDGFGRANFYNSTNKTNSNNNYHHSHRHHYQNFLNPYTLQLPSYSASQYFTSGVTSDTRSLSPYNF